MQRKRHINFKLHSIPILLDMKEDASRNSSLNNANNCNYEKNNVKSNVLYSIPCVKSCTLAFCRVKVEVFAILLLAGVINLLFHGQAYADITIGCTGTVAPEGDSSAITPIAGTTTPATISLSLSKPNMSGTTTPGSIVTVSTNVIASISNADSYNLSLKMNNTVLKNGNTTINPGNVIVDNTWGYKWDGASSYTTPSTTASNLAVPALTNNAISFTKDLTFGVKFADNAESGHYQASGVLSLVATPKTSLANLTLADITEMQQITPEICSNTPFLSGKDYSEGYTLKDVRDDSSYTVRKLHDGKCWMTSNLKLGARSIGCIDGRKLTPTTSDVSEDWVMPASITTLNTTSGSRNFSADKGDYAVESYIATPSESVGTTGYYSWSAVTAGSGGSSTADAVTKDNNATDSICPRGWRLPTIKEHEPLYTPYITQEPFFTTGMLWEIPYSFNSTWFVTNGKLTEREYVNIGPGVAAQESVGRWWTSTAYSVTSAHRFGTNSPNNTNYAGNYSNRYYGFTARCIVKS